MIRSVTLPNVWLPTRFRRQLPTSRSLAMLQPQQLTLNHKDPLLTTFQTLKLTPNHTPTAGIVLLSDICGNHTQATVAQAQRLGPDLGWTCLVPDLFSGHPHPFPTSDSTPSQTEAWREEFAFPYNRVVDLASACWEHLTHVEGVPSVGLVGYCYGGGRLVDVLSAEKRFDAGVAFYGTRMDPGLIPGMEAPTLMVFGEEDPLVEMSLVERIKGEMGKGKGKVVVYEGRGHGFVHRPGEEDAKDGEEALGEGIAWLKHYLGC